MRHFPRSILVGAVALALSTSAAAQFSNVYFFGDSVTDSGNFKAVVPPGTGRATTNPGPIWSEVFAQHFGFAANPSTQGGTNYAYVGARVTDLPGVVAPPLSPAAAVPIATQVGQYLAKGSADPNALYSIQGGGDDFFYQFDLVLAGAATPAQAQAALGTAAVNLAKQAAILKAAGARYIIVWSAPDMGTIPSGVATGVGPTLTTLTNSFNATIDATLAALGVQAIRLDTAKLQNEYLANPAAFGLKNTAGFACTLPPNVSIATCSPSTLVSPDAPNTYAWANDSHPTTAGHKILADYAISVMEAPQQMAVLGQQPLAVEQANWRALDGRMVSAINARRGPGNYEFWAAYDYGNPDYSSFRSSGSGDVNTISVGGDVKVSNRLLAGLQLSYTENKADYGGLNSKLTEPMMTLYAGYGEGPWYLGATLGAGGLDYDTSRNITLGGGTRTESGTTRGWQTVGRLVGGYWFSAGNWLHGPTLMLDYQEVRVRQFQEQGTNSTTMSFGQQQVKSFVTSVGWQAAGQLGAIRPFGRVTWEYDAKADPRDVTASVYGTGGSFSIPAYTPDDSYALFNLGASTEFGRVTGYLTASATAGKSDGNWYAVTVGLRLPF